MKIETFILSGVTLAQQEYYDLEGLNNVEDFMLDGAAVNNDAYTANYYGDYNYEAPLESFREGRIRDSKPAQATDTNDLMAMISSLLDGFDSQNSDYGQFNEALGASSSEDYNEQFLIASASTAAPTVLTTERVATTLVPEEITFPLTTTAPVTPSLLEVSQSNSIRRPTEGDSAVKQFTNFETNSSANQHVNNLRANSETYCWTCTGSGTDSVGTLTQCASSGKSQDCLAVGEQDYCKVTLRQVNGVIVQIDSGCAQADTCQNIRNFFDNNGGVSRFDHCKPPTFNSIAWGTRIRNRKHQSVCEICHYPSSDYGNQTPATVIDDASNASKLQFLSGDVKIVGETGQTKTLTASDFDSEWGSQPYNVLDVFN